MSEEMLNNFLSFYFSDEGEDFNEAEEEMRSRGIDPENFKNEISGLIELEKRKLERKAEEPAEC